MPVISLFYGIVIRMYNENDGKHHEPHIHAEYQGSDAAIALDGRVLSGSIPPKKLQMVQVWIDIHQEDLQANWRLLSAGERHFRIDPLK